MPYLAPRRRFVLELVLDVPDGLRWPAPARALAVGTADVDGRDVTDVDLLHALIAMLLARYDVLARLAAGHVEPSEP